MTTTCRPELSESDVAERMTALKRLRSDAALNNDDVKLSSAPMYVAECVELAARSTMSNEGYVALALAGLVSSHCRCVIR
jgi:hypothetical protein